MVRLLAVLLSLTIVTSCSLTRSLPEGSGIQDRLSAFPTAQLPVTRPVTVYWNDHQIPFIVAETDEDLAFSLGLVHAHLRLAQMDLLRRIAEGRISELAGPIATEIDHSLRILNYPRAAEVMERRLPPETRAWLEAFVRGVNHYQDNIDELPHEYHVLAMKREPWTVRDVLTIGRLAGTDVNWLAWFRFLRLNDRKDWPRLWRTFTRLGGDSMPSFASSEDARNLETLLAGNSRSGSNSVAVSGRRTASGAALMANDPHLGIQFPNLWLIVGIKSPSYHAVGMMVPGLPFIALGRNERIAWGGTNMRAASSDLYDVSHLPPEAFKRRTERIGVRWWFDRTVVVRETEYGPVLSDAPVLGVDDRSFALRWVGHETGDEVTALLKVQRARNWQEFRAAFKSFAVSAQNMVYADVDGNIGLLMATKLPVRRNGPRPVDFILDPRKERNLWQGFADVSDLPSTYNPADGYVASANNRPTTKAEIPIGYIFSPDDRIARLHQLLKGTGRMSVASMRRLQQDVYQISSVQLRDAYVRRLDSAGLQRLSAEAVRAIDLMRRWDGHYRISAQGPVAFEAFHAEFLERFYTRRFPDAEQRAAYTGTGRIKRLVIEDMAEARPGVLSEDLRAAAEAAGNAVATFENWGAMHRLGLAHPLAFAPLIGDKYRFGDAPVAGSTDTLMKTAHRGADGRHFTVYGQNARHISDLSHPDENYFVLLGGQDGWIGSANATDQAELWQRGEYIRVPMQIDVIQNEFRIEMRLVPEMN
jgi:penicillin amidase